MKTRVDIQFKALSILVGGDISQNPAAEDATTIDGYIDDVVAELNADGLIYIADPDAMNDALFLTFCKLVANAAAEEFGTVSDEVKAAQWRNRLRALARQTPGYGAQEVEFF